MQKRAARLSLLALLLAGTVAASFILWALERRSTASIAAHADTSAQLARMSETVAGIGAAQQAYISPGQFNEPWFERSSSLLEQLSADVGQVRGSARSAEAADVLAGLSESVGLLVTADARARQNLRLGQDLMAADVLFSDGRNLLEMMTASIRRLQDAERMALGTELGAVARIRWMTLGVTSVLLVAGLFVLTPIAQRQPVQVQTSESPSSEATTSPGLAADSELQRHQEPGGRHPVDLVSVARLCTDLSRTTSSTALPDLLGRAAGALNAAGLVLWVGSGERLLPASGHGYAPETISRMGPLERTDDNAAASAWRTGESTVVASTASTAGAVVVPLLGVHSCLGVLAFEVLDGRELDPATRAAATLIAAQLATLVPACHPENQTVPIVDAAEGPAEASQVRSA